MQEDYEGVTLGGGNVFFLFRKKERTKEKSILSFSRLVTFYSFFGVTVFFIREAARLALSLDFFICYEPEAFTMFVSAFITRFVI